MQQGQQQEQQASSHQRHRSQQQRMFCRPLPPISLSTGDLRQVLQTMLDEKMISKEERRTIEAAQNTTSNVEVTCFLLPSASSVAGGPQGHWTPTNSVAAQYLVLLPQERLFLVTLPPSFAPLPSRDAPSVIRHPRPRRPSQLLPRVFARHHLGPQRGDPSSSSSQPAPCPLFSSVEAVEESVICHIFLFLAESSQAKLRAVNKKSSDAYDVIVHRGLVPVSGTSIQGESCSHYFPITRSCLCTGPAERESLELGIQTLRRTTGGQPTEQFNLIPLHDVVVAMDAMIQSPYYRAQWGVEVLSVTSAGQPAAAATPPDFLQQMRSGRRLITLNTELLVCIRGQFLRGCGTLLEAYFAGLSSVTAVEENWMQGCDVLKKVYFGRVTFPGTKPSHTQVLPGMGNLRTVASGWMHGCTALESLSFNGLVSLTSVGDHWMAYCAKLTFCTGDWKDLQQLETVGACWLIGCDALESLAVQDLRRLRDVGQSWLVDCQRLHSVAFMNLPNLTSVGTGWLANCPNLKSYCFFFLPSLRVVGRDLAEDTPNPPVLRVYAVPHHEWLNSAPPTWKEVPHQ